MKKVLVGILALLPALAAAADLDMCHSGSWYEPATDGQGLSVEVMRDEWRDGPDVVIYYYTYMTGGWPAWFICAGNRGYGEATIPCLSVVGQTPPLFDPADQQQEDAGFITFDPHSQRKATITWSPSDLIKNWGHERSVMEMEQLVSICD